METEEHVTIERHGHKRIYNDVFLTSRRFSEKLKLHLLPIDGDVLK